MSGVLHGCSFLPGSSFQRNLETHTHIHTYIHICHAQNGQVKYTFVLLCDWLCPSSFYLPNTLSTSRKPLRNGHAAQKSFCK